MNVNGKNEFQEQKIGFTDIGISILQTIQM